MEARDFYRAACLYEAAADAYPQTPGALAAADIAKLRSLAAEARSMMA